MKKPSKPVRKPLDVETLPAVAGGRTNPNTDFGSVVKPGTGS